MKEIIIIRLGESEWNKENRFTGWQDVELSDKGIEEAIDAGKLLLKTGYHFTLAYSSVLRRANETLRYVLKEIGQVDLETIYSWKLNERHYGALQGLNKDETRQRYGDAQVQKWRRDMYEKPPLLLKSDKRYPGHDEKYKNLAEAELPLGENLFDTMQRVNAFYEESIEPSLKAGAKILIVAHGNSLRALVAYLEHLDDAAVMKLEIPTGRPVVLEMDDDLKLTKRYFLDEKGGK